MAGGQERILRRRIRSIQATRKTTRAMELIAGSRIARAQARIAGARPYGQALDELVADLAAAPGAERFRLFSPPAEGSPLAVVVIAGDRGLSGAYNANVLRATEQLLAREAGRVRTLLAVGRRAQVYLRFRGRQVDRLFTGMTDRPTYEDAREVAGPLLAAIDAEEVGEVRLVSTCFVSLGTQRVEIRPLFPVVAEAGTPVDFETEPDRAELAERLLPVVVTARLHQALLEASASEHAARQRAMKAATDNADELITTLRRVMNRARQDAITTEIMDIVGGAEALRGQEGVVLPPLPGIPAELLRGVA
jgi:F-type H+-transporting ATPase subunit gamma